MSYIQNHPLLAPLPEITRHDQLPPESECIAELRKGNKKNNPAYMFIKRGDSLSILITYTTVISGQEKYICRQKDFPLKVLSWFPKALEEFIKSPANGGLHAGAMTSGDQDVDGEMLSVGSTTKGYEITNWSRDASGANADPDYYEPTNLNLDYDLLYDYGLLELWKTLGEKYERGEI
ncbi:hypothetical protein [Ketobacter sp.]|uniref:hypothetical protein n=1 Tax=Ketobacter sp. TaxID=2083498 RepID=UPI000F23AB08|nr:hypothetical protein [Ketobacter sp.]RLU00128.1 MAG: hypothetical protein D9N14_06445 [Ketobacter sp.]